MVWRALCNELAVLEPITQSLKCEQISENKGDVYEIPQK